MYVSMCKALIYFGNELHLSHFVASSSQILSFKHSTLITSLEFEELYLHGIRERLSVLQSSLHSLWKSNNHEWHHTFWMQPLFNSSKLYYLISRDSKRWIRHPQLTKNENNCAAVILIPSVSGFLIFFYLLTCFWHPFFAFFTGCRRVWLQFKWFFDLPEPEQDWRDPVTEQDSQPAENQVSVQLW